MRSRSASMLALAAAVIPQASYADVGVMPQPAGDRVSIQQPTACQADPAPDSDIVVLSTSGQAGSIVPYAIDERGVSRLIPVSGGKGRAVTLVLASQGSAVWDLRGVAADRIKAVYVSGSGAQGVIGASPTTKVEFSDDPSGYGGGQCRFNVAALSADGAVAAAVSIQAKFGRYPDRLFAGRTASAFDLDSTKAKVPTSADVKLADIRTSRQLSPDTPPPAPLLFKRLLDDGSIRILDSSAMAQIRNAGGEITPIQAQTAGRPITPPPGMLDRPGITPEMRASIIRSYEMREQARLEQMARMSSYVPSNGIVVLKPIQSIPQMTSGDYGSAVFIPSDITPPAQSTGRMYRLPVKASEVPTSGREGSSPLTRMLDGQPGTEPEVAAVWKGDSMTIRMPQTGENGGRRVSATAPLAEHEEGSSKGLIALLAVALLTALGGMAFLAMRRRRTAMPDAPIRPATAQGGPSNRVEALEVMVQDPELKAAVRTFREAAMRLIARQDLEDDLSAKANDVLQKQFSAQATRYLSARPSADAETGAELDRRMLASLRTMTAQLDEIGAIQNKRHLDALA